MFQVGVRAFVRVAVLAVVLILAACGGSSAPKAQSSLQPSATPTPTAGSKLTWAVPMHIDDPASIRGISLVGVSCPNDGLCVAIDDHGNAVTSSNPTGGAAAWNVTNVDGSVGPNSNGPRLIAVSCPSSGLCVGVDGGGNVVTSANPTGGATAWTQTHVDGSNYLTGVSCPSSSLCVAVDTFGNVVTSTNPTGGVAAWMVTKKGQLSSSPYSQNGLSSISCPSNILCIAGDYLGNLLRSTNPAGGATAWKVTHKGGSQCTLSETGALCAVTAVSCVSALCVATDYQGNMVTSANPGAGVAAWRVTHLNTSTHLTNVSCTSTTLCVGVDNGGKVFSSSNPDGGAAAWKAADVDGINSLNGVSCPSAGFCVVVDAAGNVVTSNKPAGGAAAWKVTFVDGTNSLRGVSCPSSDLCVALGGGKEVVTSTNPTGGATAWTVTTLAGEFALGDISCPTRSLCVATGAAGDGTTRVVVTSTNPTGGPSAWTVTDIGRSDGLEVSSRASCPSSGLCVAVGESVDGHSTIVTSTNPTGGASAWKVTTFNGEFVLLDVSCPTTSLCVAVTNGGDALISTNPTGGAAAWKLTHIDTTPNNNNYLSGVSCPSISLCVAVDYSGGNVVTSSDPTGGVAAWTVTNVDGNKSLIQVSCSDSRLCVAVDDYGNVVTSSNPRGGKAAWTATSVDRAGAGFSGISCPGSNLCVAVDNSGNVVTGTRQP